MVIAVATHLKQWTLEELHRLPEDGNKYELVRGELFVTPPPTYDHETIGAVLNGILAPYVQNQRLGLVYRPKAVMRHEGSQSFFVAIATPLARSRRAPGAAL